MSDRDDEDKGLSAHRLLQVFGKALPPAMRLTPEVRRPDQRELSDEDWLIVHEALAVVLRTYGLPCPWRDECISIDLRIEAIRLITELDGRPHLATELLKRDPSVLRGEGTLRNAREGGLSLKGRRKGPSDDTLRREVRALTSTGEGRTNACKRVARQHGISARTVLRRTEETAPEK